MAIPGAALAAAGTPTTTGRRSYRPPLGVPNDRTNWRLGSAVSVLVHAGVLLLLLLPVGYGGLLSPIKQGAGGPGPAGGGGGRSAARMELIEYVRVRPPAPPAQPVAQLTPPPVMPLALPQLEQLTLPVPVVALGTLGTAADATGGAGPGTGGGVGSGVGTGRGSSIGPGTGGGNQPNYPPTPTEMFIPPLPVPPAIRGARIIAEFDVDERGRVLSMAFTETSDRGYNRRLAEVLRTFRFRPGTRLDGTPIRMKAQVIIDLP